jgi:bacterioferritin-associated ferredoxin
VKPAARLGVDLLDVESYVQLQEASGMYVCLCVGVTDRVIKELARDGACPNEVSACTGAGTRCGTCISTIRDLVHETQASAEPRRRLDVVQVPAENAA